MRVARGVARIALFTCERVNETASGGGRSEQQKERASPRVSLWNVCPSENRNDPNDARTHARTHVALCTP